MPQLHSDFQHLAELGFHWDCGIPQWANDAQPPLITQANAGIPWQLTNIILPGQVDTLFAPTNAVKVAGGEVQRGDWTTFSSQFRINEITGFISAYSDYGNAGRTKTNDNWVPRESYHYQTGIGYGQKEMARAALAKIDLVANLRDGVIQVINRAANKFYFYGVQGLLCYGILNDPGLPAPITPHIKTAGGTSWSNATTKEVFADVQKLFQQLVTQLGGLVDMNSKMTLAMPNLSQVYLNNATDFNVVAKDMVLKAFPNMTVEVAPEYGTTSGNLLQLIVDIDGQKTMQPAYTEKMRAHALVQASKSWEQDFSAGTWGTIIARPIAVAQMLGV